MGATIGARELPKSGRKGPGLGLVMALVVAVGVLGGSLVLRAGITSPAPPTPKVVTIQTTRKAPIPLQDWSSQQALRAAR